MPYWDSALLPAAGALLSSPADLEKFLRAQLDPASTEFGAAIRLSRVSHTENLAVRPAGLGWMLDRNADTNLAWHNGGTRRLRHDPRSHRPPAHASRRGNPPQQPARERPGHGGAGDAHQVSG